MVPSTSTSGVSILAPNDIDPTKTNTKNLRPDLDDCLVEYDRRRVHQANRCNGRMPCTTS
jgi:hypothetical protein